MDVLSAHLGLVNDKTAVKSMNKKTLAKHAAAQAVNTAKTNVKDTIILAGGTAATVGATIGIAKSTKLQGVIQKGVNAFKNSGFGKALAETGKEIAIATKPYIQKGVNCIKNLPGPAKAAAAIGAILTTGAIIANEKKGYIEAGKITQNCIDKDVLAKSI